MQVKYILFFFVINQRSAQMAQQITCKNCGNRFTGKFCNQCGEKVYTEKDKHLSHFFEEGLYFITHFEGKVFTTLKTFFKAPGKLSLDYCNGLRKKYFKPLSFFLLLIVIYLLFPKLFFDGLNMRLNFYPENSVFGKFASEKITKTMQETGIDMKTLSEVFHQKGEKASKLLLLIIIPLTALVFWALTFGKRKLFFDQMVFSTEINSFFILWNFMLLPILVAIVALTINIFGGTLQFNDMTSMIAGYIPLLIYVYIAAKRFYQLKWWQNLIVCTIFLFSHHFIVFVLYKFALFTTVINQIH